MDFDYSKVVNFLYGKQVNKLNEVLKVIINNGFIMTNVDTSTKIIFLEKNGVDYFLLKRGKRVVILPANYYNLSFCDEFGEVIEISINNDGDIITSSIFNITNPNGVIATTTTWHFNDNLYSQVVGRVMFIEKEKMDIVQNKESIEMFINSYYPRRNDVFNDLYWDMESFRKNNFIETKVSERIQVNDGYSGEEFSSLYKKQIDKVLEIVKDKGKSSLF